MVRQTGRAKVELTKEEAEPAHQGGARADALGGGERLRQGDRPRRQARARRHRARAGGEAAGHPQERAARVLPADESLEHVGGLEILKGWLGRARPRLRRGGRASSACPSPRGSCCSACRAAARASPPRPSPPPGGCRSCGSTWGASSRAHRLVGGEPAQGHPHRRERGAGGALGGRDREGALRARLLGPGRRRRDGPRLRHASSPGCRRRPRRCFVVATANRIDVAAAGAAAQGALRRDLLRRPAGRAGAPGDPPDPPGPPRPRPGRLRPRRPGAGRRRLQRRGDRAGGGGGALRGLRRPGPSSPSATWCRPSPRRCRSRSP